jgi:hypothetical protein
MGSSAAFRSCLGVAGLDETGERVGLSIWLLAVGEPGTEQQTWLARVSAEIEKMNVKSDGDGDGKF